MRAVLIVGGLSRPLCYYSILCPTQQEADQFQKYFGCSTPHPSPACRDFTFSWYERLECAWVNNPVETTQTSFTSAETTSETKIRMSPQTQPGCPESSEQPPQSQGPLTNGRRSFGRSRSRCQGQAQITGGQSNGDHRNPNRNLPACSQNRQSEVTQNPTAARATDGSNGNSLDKLPGSVPGDKSTSHLASQGLVSYKSYIALQELISYKSHLASQRLVSYSPILPRKGWFPISPTLPQKGWFPISSTLPRKGRFPIGPTLPHKGRFPMVPPCLTRADFL
ncbi:hypothetical protein PoB_003034000 [Plakobranchus ocellatus]|uniref:Uncharacterized protein n=1 Tax=Plakobranchus ocellatus TaxID=259542 RepID=A0AAV4A6N6_9GAST|nr:hypothetical protein PoB_003034000 [Plakobranchus ocellatus]